MFGENVDIKEMTLRDYFAAAAITGITTGDYLQSPEKLSETAYLIADEMLKQREKPF
jgi:hypothetical protein